MIIRAVPADSDLKNRNDILEVQPNEG